MMASQVVLMFKKPSANSGNIRNISSIPGLGRSPGEGNGNTLRYSCLRISWTVEPYGLCCVGLGRTGHN